MYDVRPTVGQSTSVPSGSVTCQVTVFVSVHVEAPLLEMVVAPTQGLAVSRDGVAVRFPAEGVIGIAPGHRSIATDPDAGGGEQHDGLAGRAAEESLSAAEVDDRAGGVVDDTADAADQSGVDRVVGVQAPSALGAHDDVAVSARVGGFAAQVCFERFVVDQDVHRGARGLRAGRCGRGGAGHRDEGVGVLLLLGSCQVVGGGGAAESSAGVGPVALPFGFEEPGEDLVELGPVELGQAAAEDPAAVGPRSDREVARRLLVFALREVTCGVGEGLPGSGTSFELVERLLDCVVEK